MTRSRRSDALGPGGVGAVVLLTLCAGLRAAGLLMIAQGLADGISALASGATDVGAAAGIGAAGALLRALATWAQGVVAARGAITAKSRLRTQLVEHVVASGGASAADARLATDGIDDLDDYYGTVLPAAVGAVVIPVTIGLRILSIDPVSALAIGVTLPLIPVFMVLIGMHTRERVESAQSALDRLAGHLVELAHGLPVLVGLGRVAEQTDALRRIQDDYRRRTQLTLRTAFLSALALELLATLSVAVVAVLLGVRLLAGEVALSTALIALLLAPECFAGLRDLGAAFHSSQDGRSALRRMTAMLATPASPRAASAGIPRVHRLAVQYTGRSHPALGSITASFTPGSVTVVTGASGAGKSTLLAALAGTLDESAVVSGEISGVDPRWIAYAPQVVHVAAETLGEELALYSDDAHAVDNVVSALGLDRARDRRAAQLSPGELRRVGVARALLRVDAGASLLVLDEPTAHLDAVSAGAVRRAIGAVQRPGLTTVLVSHDPGTRALADRVVAVDTSTEASTRGSLRAEEPPGAETVPLRDVERVHSPMRRSALSALALLLAPSAGRWLLAVGVGVISSGFGLALIGVSGWLIVRAGSQPAIMYLLVAIVGVRFFGIARSVTRYLERLLTHDAAFELAGRMRLRLWAAIAARGAGSRELLEGGSALDYLVSTTDRVRDLLPRVLAPLAVGVLTVAGIAVTTALVTPVLSVTVAVGLVATLAAAIVLATAREARNQRRQVETGAALTRRVFAISAAASDLLANGVGERAVRRVARLGEDLARAERRTAWTSGLATAVVIAGTGLLATWIPSAGSGRAAELIAVVSLLVLASADPLAAAVLAAQRTPALLASIGRLGGLLRDDEHPPPVGEEHPEGVDELALTDVAVTWPGREHAVFAGVTVTATPGEWIVIDGPSGAGKSTLLSAIMGAIPASGGTISADGVPIERIDPATWRRRVAWCPQEAHVFDSTLRGNLLLARPRDIAVEDHEMVDALTRVGLAPLLRDLDSGLDGMVGRSGRSLSGGERQRLAVARALLADADILLLDEPTAHLDQPTADAMMSDIRKAAGGRIVVLVSHRSSDHLATDRVADLGRGTLVPAALTTASLA